uniref:WAP domain-containing protein n=1 Tax=Naja naja TaxID=35670 RepID=A0A8C6VES4_NAJNA
IWNHGEKPGLCPFIREKCRMLNPPNDCDYDFQCGGNLKCCEGICGRECLPPVYGMVCTEIMVL